MRRKMTPIMLTAPVLLMVAATLSSANQRIIYVDDDAGVPGDGSSWQTAYKFLQDALADANDSEKPVEVRVARGIYKPDRSSAHPDGTRDGSAIFCLLDNVAILGGFAGIGAHDPDGRHVGLYETILSGDLAGDDAVVADPCDLLTEPTRAENGYALVTAGACSRSAVLDGFTIRSGNALGSQRHELEQQGAGLLLPYYGGDSCPSIRNCTFLGNCAYYGGAAYVIGAAPELINCKFLDNAATEGGAIATSAWRCPCTSACDFVIRGCLFAGNYARGTGGAIHKGPGAPFTIEGSSFTRNSASEGGAIYNSQSTGLVNCLLIHNVAAQSGGAIYSGGYELDINSCTFADNAASVGLALTCFTPLTTITNTIFWNGGDERHEEIFIGAVTGMSITYSNVRDNWPPGESNIDVDPLFAAPGQWDPNGTPDDPNDDFWVDGDYHLKSQAGRWDPASENWVLDEVTSPCIDAGDPYSPIGLEPFPNGGRINMGAYGGTAEASKSYVAKP
jgi:predicted outer membrane repeat protein